MLSHWVTDWWWWGVVIQDNYRCWWPALITVTAAEVHCCNKTSQSSSVLNSAQPWSGFWSLSWSRSGSRLSWWMSLIFLRFLRFLMGILMFGVIFIQLDFAWGLDWRVGLGKYKKNFSHSIPAVACITKLDQGTWLMPHPWSSAGRKRGRTEWVS